MRANSLLQKTLMDLNEAVHHEAALLEAFADLLRASPLRRPREQLEQWLVAVDPAVVAVSGLPWYRWYRPTYA
jgi:hypothetical protein